MNNRLDFYNEANKYLETLSEDDYFMMVGHNKKDGDLMLTAFGDWEQFSTIFSNKEVLTQQDGLEGYDNIKSTLLNTVFNICAQDVETKNTFINSLKNL